MFDRQSSLISLSVRTTLLIAMLAWHPASCRAAAPMTVREAFPDPAFHDDRFAHLPPDQLSMMREYFNAYLMLKSHYSNMTLLVDRERRERPREMLAEHRAANSTGELQLTESSTVRMHALGGTHYRFDYTPRRDAFEASTASPQILVIDPDNWTELGVDERTRQSFLSGHGRTDDDAWASIQSQLFPIAPFAETNLPLQYIIFDSPDPARKVVSVTLKESEDLPGESLAVVTVARTEPGSEVLRRIELLRRRKWALHRLTYESRYDGKHGRQLSSAEQRCYYSGQTGDFPNLTRVEYSWSENRPGEPEASLRAREEFNVRLLQAQAPSRDVFDVDAILGRKRLVVPEQRTAWWWWLLLNGFALFLIGGCLLRRRQRREENGGT